jgi:hypothetical protein
MATKYLKTSLQVNFGDYEDKQNVLWEEDPEKEDPEINKKYVRLYPDNVPIRFATAGNLSYGSQKIAKQEEIIVFSGNDEVNLRYPEAYNVTFDLIGKFYNESGVPIAVTFQFDASRNMVTSSAKGYAAVRVKYRAKYTGFLYTFSGGPCPGLQVGPYAPATPVPTVSPYKEGVLVALDPGREAVATLNMSPPNCKEQTFYVAKGAEAELPRIDLVIDPNYPARLTADIELSTGNISVPYLASMTKVRLIPSVTNVSVDVNNPEARIKLEEKGLEQEVSERILFSGSSSANLQFQAKASVSITPRGVWRDKSGESVSVEVRGPGQKVTEVDRTPSGGYTNPRTRIVGPDELVVCDTYGKVLEAFGVVDVAYTYDYDLYRLDLPYNASDKKFRSVYVTALHERAPDRQEPATLFIEAPSMEGIG